jgi:hypothetical protein
VLGWSRRLLEGETRGKGYVVKSDLGLCYVCRVVSLLLVRLLLISLLATRCIEATRYYLNR